MNRQPGFFMVELLVVLALLGLCAALGLTQGGEALARQRVEAATRRLALGIERARAEAEERGRPCGLSLGPQGWEAPAGSGLDPCGKAVMPLGEGVGEDSGTGSVLLQHTLPPMLRFSSNGLVLDGGTVVLAGRGTSLRRCLVMALPLGIVRLGRYGGPAQGTPDSAACQPDPAL
jgi:prepilin-type N-terminal cleavage/methylation domain-containing protein